MLGFAKICGIGFLGAPLLAAVISLIMLLINALAHLSVTQALVIASVGVIILCTIAVGIARFANRNPAEVSIAQQQYEICLGAASVVATIQEGNLKAVPAIFTAITSCYQAFVAIVHSFDLPGNPGITVDTGQASNPPPVWAPNQTYVFNNCAGGTTLREPAYPILLKIPVVLQIGSHTFVGQPDDSDNSVEAAIARYLIGKNHIPIGTNLFASGTLVVEVPPHTKESITVTVLLNRAAGTASEHEGQIDIATHIDWWYPTSASLPNPSVTTISSCP